MKTRFDLLAFSLVLLTSGSVAAGGAGDPVTGKPLGAMTSEEKAQKLDRRACRIEVCDILSTKEQQGPDVACDIAWTWHEAEIVDAIGGRVDWPWGKMVCQSKIELERAPLAKAMSERRYTITTDTQTVRCSLHHKDGEPYVIELSFAPKVTFENGKATEAAINWGELTAPSGIYSLLYAATSLDNSTNVMGPEVARSVNEFTQKECAKVEDELPGRRVN